MSGTARPPARRPAQPPGRPVLLPSLAELIPWTDRRGRFHPLRGLALALASLPGIVLAVRWCFGLLGADPISVAIHSTGYWAVWVLLASLCVTPSKALGGAPNVVVVRRLLGNASMAYAGIHLLLYCADQNWNPLTIATEIVKRFYLTIGFVAVLGLLVLAATSTDGWARFLGKTWKRLHRAAYLLTLLALVHFVLQSKLDVSHALLASGVFLWLMLWRLLPLGRDRSAGVLLGVTAVAVVLTAGVEFFWYWLGTKVNPGKAVLAELDISYGLHPAVQVLLLGLLAVLLVLLRRLAERDDDRRGTATMLAYGLAGLLGVAAPWFFGWVPGLVVADQQFPLARNVAWVLLLALLGRARWALDSDGKKTAVDALLIALVVFDTIRLTTDDPADVLWGGVALAVVTALLAARLLGTSRQALLLLPPAALLAYGAVLAASAPVPV